MMFLLTGIHVVACLFLIFVVLLQSAQAADLAGAFGGGGSQTALGMRGATTLLHKATTSAAVIFMLTSLALGMLGRETTSLLEGLDTPAATAPADGAAAPGVDTAPVPATDQSGEAATVPTPADEQGEQGAASGSDQNSGEQGAAGTGEQGSQQ